MESETFFLFSFSGLIWKKAERVLKLHEGSSFGWFTGAWIELGKKPSSTRCLRTAVWERCASAHAYGLPWVAVGLRTRRRVFLQEDLSLPSYKLGISIFALLGRLPRAPAATWAARHRPAACRRRRSCALLLRKRRARPRRTAVAMAQWRGRARGSRPARGLTAASVAAEPGAGGGPAASAAWGPPSGKGRAGPGGRVEERARFWEPRAACVGAAPRAARRHRVPRSRVGRLHRAWRAARRGTAAPAPVSPLGAAAGCVSSRSWGRAAARRAPGRAVSWEKAMSSLEVERSAVKACRESEPPLLNSAVASSRVARKQTRVGGKTEVDLTCWSCFPAEGWERR